MNPLQTLVHEAMQTQRLTRAQLAGRMGYKNISKGLRRLDALLHELQGSEGLLQSLKEALSIPDAQLREAVLQLQEQLNAEERACFEPIIQVVPTRTPSPIFVAALVPGLLNIPVPDDLLSLPADEEFSVVCDLYRKHRETWKPWWAGGKGAIYHRNYDERFEFDEDCRLVKVHDHSIGFSRAVLRVSGKPLQLHFETNEGANR
jgi:hypothetical protein